MGSSPFHSISIGKSCKIVHYSCAVEVQCDKKQFGADEAFACPHYYPFCTFCDSGDREELFYGHIF